MNALYYGEVMPPITLTAPRQSLIDAKVLERALRNIYRKKFNVTDDIEPHLFQEFADIFNQAADEGFSQSVNHDEEFRKAIRHNNNVFAAFKTHRFQNDMAAQLIDANGNLKPFEQWKNDIQSIASHQCRAWLETEYNTAVLRAHQAADWQQFLQEADVLPNLKWLPSTSPNPGADHMPFWGTILPIDDPFWDQHRPGDRWNCKCGLMATDEPTTPVPSLTGQQQPKNTPQRGLDNNPGKDGKLFSDSHPYIANAYPGAQQAVEKAVREMEEWDIDKTFGDRLRINKKADKTELEDNIRAAKDLLDSFKEMTIKIREHVLINGVPNPEYEINELIADRKGIEGEKGITSAFKKAIKQGCQTVVIDLDMHMGTRPLPSNQLSKYIDWRRKDFETGKIKECYIIYRGRAVLIDKSFINREEIANELEKLKQ